VVNHAWYRIALAHGDRSPTVVIAPGDHLGAALATAVSRFDSAWPIAVAQAPPNEVPLGESVGKGVVVEPGTTLIRYPTDVIRWPVGVIPSMSVSPHGVAAIRTGWFRHPDEAITVIEAVVDGDRLAQVFLWLVEHLPAADNLEIRILDHHDGGGPSEVWLSPRLSPRRAIRFLDDHRADILENGHIELSIYLRRERSTLRLTEHKTVVWLSDDPETATQFTAWLAMLNVPPVDALVTIGGIGHFHYRPPRSSSRERMTTRLAAMKLRRVA